MDTETIKTAADNARAIRDMELRAARLECRVQSLEQSLSPLPINPTRVSNVAINGGEY